MKKTTIITILLILFFSCTKEMKPTSLPPSLTLNEAKEITRNTAILSGEIDIHENGLVRSCRFKYGTSPLLTDATEIITDETEGYTEATLSGLQAGVEYYFSIQAGNGFSSVQSATKSFRTIPNSTPALSEITLINKGPFSAVVECMLTDNGGETPTALGFKYRTATGGKEQFITAELTGNGNFKAKLPDLDMETDYQVQAYAANSVGEVYSNNIGFTTDNAIYTSEAGALAEIIGEKQKYRLSQISIAGKLNGSDLRLIRDMMGRDVNGGETPGRLYDLSLLDAYIVKGGESYYASRYTADDTLGYGTFADCQYLQRIVLPRSLKVIEKDAFLNCSALVSMTIPDNTVRYTPSEGCYRLAQFAVSALNPNYAEEDGVLYDKKKTTLLQYPEGKTGSSFLIPASVVNLADNAFQRCPLETLEIPNTVTTLGIQVFRNSALQSITLSDKIETIPNGTFQGCTSLSTITLGSATSLISNYCFDRCPLRDLYIRATLPPICYSQTFNNTDLFSQCTLHVPAKTKAFYRGNGSWKKFERIVEE